MSIEPLAISVRQATQLAPIGVTTIYKLISEGRLKSTMVDGRRLIYYRSFCDLLGVISEKLNPPEIPENRELSVPTALPTRKGAVTGEGRRKAAKRKRRKIKGRAARHERLRRYAKGN